MKYLLIFGLSALLMLGGCAGVKFADAPVNKQLPETFTKRSLYPAGVAGYEFQDLVGNILLIKPKQDPLRIGMIRPSDYESNVIPITDPNNYYKSRIQKGAEVNGSYLAFAADFSSDRMAELELVDIARAGVVFDDTNFNEILEAATDWVADHPRTDTNSTRIWIKSVVLTRRIYSDFTEVGAKASGQVGDVVGVSTGVYNKNEQTIKSVLVAFDAFDIDELVASSSADTLSMFAEMNMSAIDDLAYTQIIAGEIEITLED